MKNKTLRVILLAVVAVILVVCSFGGGFAAGHFLPLGPNSVPILSSNGNQGGTPSDLTSLFAPFWEAWTIVHQQYVDQPVDNTKLMQGAITGMINSLGDAHSNYWTPQVYQDNTNFLQGQYAGIGAYVDTSGKLLTITKPIAGSPAEKAGLQAGDQIIKIDGQDITNLDAESVRQ
jgi:carboxyl-terminal processing protease